ncbi:hypothetical protein H310_00756 [Aphanomyces invadans]|uniref:Uncharacterized protein n=1 Tax=Aphanomyces invadans TaxID=157072 RepID=A0A024UVC0_9STRA|nr:hypothetical protein H310_00756 [Aphanomyces invadans]ETW10451.1 hypothetical protein H310_00756 [Aphanomyces invadans]|eukprot:XP_008861862.1 hypothetical protein H310_00756 [Aphanomyces invadans]
MPTDNNAISWRWTLAPTAQDTKFVQYDSASAPSSTSYSDDAAMLVPSDDQHAALADRNQMLNFGRPGYEHEWAPTEHQASETLAMSTEMASPLALARAWSEELVQSLWTPPQMNSQVALEGAVVVGFVAIVALVVTRIYIPSAPISMSSFGDQDDEFDDVYHPLL